MEHLRPELKNNKKLQKETKMGLYNWQRQQTPLGRARLFYLRYFSEETQLQQFLHRHGQRSNLSRLALLSAFSFYCGTILYYLNYKINVQEPKWVEDYGSDIPYFKKFKLLHLIQYYRAKYVHFYRYKVFYYIEEQQIDPLNDNSLNSKAFDVYQYKRLIRAMTYDQKRDTSFDFLQTGEDDIDQYDDFV